MRLISPLLLDSLVDPLEDISLILQMHHGKRGVCIEPNYLFSVFIVFKQQDSLSGALLELSFNSKGLILSCQLGRVAFNVHTLGFNHHFIGQIKILQ